ncbi:alpha/beta hydrolase [Pseudoduganella sp.]|uniref:alpha/beta hydrolase n=1 Tax=Pseudoduganella sp. TaxID=1880898 RepID=UPI0035B456A2
MLKYVFCALPLLLCGTATAQMPVDVPIETAGPMGPLKGMLLEPASGSRQVALIIPGSGPTDRDGNSRLGVQASTYKLLARDLAAQGVATVRIDKRGMFSSAAAVPDANAVTIADYVADVHSWVGTVRQRTGAACVWLIGHSEGGLVAMAAAEAGPGVCGLVLVSAAGRPMGAVLRDQIKANPANAPLMEQAMSAISSLEQGRRVDAASLHPALQGLFAPPVQGFLISAFSYDPARLLARYPKPVMILHGQRDIQVGERDAYALKQAAPKAKLVLLSNVNHVLKVVASDDVRANLAAYSDPALPLAPGVGSAIAEFLMNEE